ncbi:Flightin [Pseudolycoriella hygida]|uniref:Flightin n=1 Tax=Pseudolycoriella hygida TaxID=35572 RepID=A0A9Q0S453_9DIPT|nr:Flightin [Pseudolycoriella hygida]
MADEDPWGGADEEETPAPAPAAKTGSQAGSQAGSKTGSKVGTPKGTGTAGKNSRAETPTGDAAADGETREEAEVPPQEDPNRPRPLQLYRHWVRPKFLQYRYMYDYRTNYYDDVIDYLDKRGRGVNREVPRAQTWAERVLRTHTNPSALEYYKGQQKEDKHLIQTIAATIRTHNYHTKAYENRRAAKLLS